MSSSIGLAVLLSSVTFSNAFGLVTPHSAGAAPAVDAMPPSSSVRNWASLKVAPSWPRPVYQERPPS